MIQTYLKVLCILHCIILSCFASAQDTANHKSKLQSKLYLDTYYAYDFNKPSGKKKAAFLYNHNRHNEVNINLVLASLRYNGEATRASLGLMAGTYAQYNLVAEPQMLQHVYEANAGFKISKHHNVWFDMGILPSHIGFESAISKDCHTITRSILAENSPYYEAGAKVSYTTRNKKWHIAALVLNGWQRISRVAGNNTPAFGTQLTYTPSGKISLNWSTFMGNDKADSIKQWRYFNNLYTLWQLHKNWGLILGFDYGLEQKQKGSVSFNKWYSPVAILRYENDNWAVAARAEFYSDKTGVIVPLVNAQPFRMQGYSINADRKIGGNALGRIEWRILHSASPYFEKSNGFATTNPFLTASFVIDIN